MLTFSKLKEHHLSTVLEWRVKPEVSRFMLTNVEYNLEKQQNWYKRVVENPAVAYWVINYWHQPIGLINLAAIDRGARNCNAGFYLGELQFRQVAAIILPYFYNFVFKFYDLHKIYGEVLEGNESILAIHKLHGYRHVGTYQDHVFRDGKYLSLHIVELMADVWLAQRRYRKYIAEFEV